MQKTVVEEPSASENHPQWRAVHLSLQGKGGVGKSLIASLLAQFYRAKRVNAACVDADPVNQTFAQYTALGAKHLQLMDGNQIDRRRFDSLIEAVIGSDIPFIVDNGASTFIPLWHYMLENSVPSVLDEASRKLYIHTVVTGGQALGDTLTGFKSLAESCQSRQIIVWVNEYFGKVELEGKRFSQFSVFSDHKDKIIGTVVIRKLSPDTFGKDMEEMIARKLTFDEAIEQNGFSLMSRQRLRMIQRDIFEQLDKLDLL